ncbi:DNA gyrase, A subunit [Acididesulfobacillus acetoxydans]|uniref:DNA gyrase subunit A n=1 Tax=Acididesulfobacillus acetoxydans TaxID=1561005 RepID=A0A8S0Y1R4_9FIRM|nr:DNA gyrase subunit A [Acididesulfobacillus acetoxydans]CAA7599845.1 DNA gyrase, A subunit [Acididesulfobacillus acetoxydans]CEJ07411.1 DNA gyrase subunit A [Acididesulfobacillus acetoxydans]
MSLEMQGGKVLPVEISNEMKRSYIDYAMSVIVGRSLPDVRDGLKPVHRRILYTLHELGMTPNKAYSKSARLVGDCMAKFHPHGDAAIYDAVVRMAQGFSSRYPLIDGHGNFGSVDGDSAAAMRYTELRMSKLAPYMLADLDKETVDFVPNYDEKEEEPTVLPAKFPNLLVNGSAGIAVAMATNIPPHNLGEVIQGTVALIDNPDLTLDGLMNWIKGPDFPTGGIIMGTEGIKSAYSTGRGNVRTRARAAIEPMEKSGKNRIVVTEIPFLVNKAKLVERIAELVREKRLDGVTDLRDESDRTGMQIVIELRRDVNPQVILNQLYKHTSMEESFGITLLALVDGKPKVLNLKEILHLFIEHQKEVIVRRTRYDLNKAEAEAHILEGLRIALDHIDEVISTIRSSADEGDAKENLMSRFGLSQKQAQAIVDMRLKRLTGLEREKLEEDYQELLNKIAYFRAVLASEKMVLEIIKTELNEIKEKFGDERRTRISFADSNVKIEDLIEEEDVVITVTHDGYIKRLPLNTYKSQRRGGKGVHGMATKEEDFVEHLFITSTHHYLLFFTSRGRMFRLKAYEIPEASRTAKGTAIVNLLSVNSDETITAVLSVKEFTAECLIFMATKQGIVKRTRLCEYNSSRRDGLIALNLDEGDELIGVRLTKGEEDIILATAAGLCIRFPEADVREMGRTARGVKGITLAAGDVVVGMDVAGESGDLLTMTENGYAKRSNLTEYRAQGRGGKGLIGMRVTAKTGRLAGVKVVQPEDELMVITNDGLITRQEVAGISKQGRTAQGVMAMRTDEGKVVAIAKVVNKEEDGETLEAPEVPEVPDDGLEQ